MSNFKTVYTLQRCWPSRIMEWWPTARYLNIVGFARYWNELFSFHNGLATRIKVDDTTNQAEFCYFQVANSAWSHPHCFQGYQVVANLEDVEVTESDLPIVNAKSVAFKVKKAVGHYGAKEKTTFPMSLDDVEDTYPDRAAGFLRGVHWEYKKPYEIFPGAPVNFTAHFASDDVAERDNLYELMKKKSKNNGAEKE